MSTNARKSRTRGASTKRTLTGAPSSRRPRLVVERLEDRLAPAGDLLFRATNATPLTLRVVGEDFQIVDSEAPFTVLASSPLAAITAGVRIEGADFDLHLTVDASVPQVRGGIRFDAGTGTNTLAGLGVDSTWHVIGPGAGHLHSPDWLSFTGVTNLRGAADNRDTFLFAAGGSLAGVVDGGAGGFDSMVIDSPTPGRVQFTATGPHSGTVALLERTITYDGLEPITLVGPQTVVSVTGSASDDIMLVEDLGGGVMRVRSGHASPTFESVQFETPANSLLVDGGGGTDEIRIIGPGGVDTDNEWTIKAENAGSVNDLIDFSSIENLKGGSAADLFIVQPDGSITGTIDGGTGDDTLIGPNAANVWNLSGANAGALNATDFVAIENLTGGSADDTFNVVGASASLSGVLDGGLFDFAAPTVNSLDFSQRGSAVSVNLELATATAVAGGFSRITKVVGSSSTDTLIGPLATFDHTTWTVTGTNAGTVDFTAFAGFENLTGQNASSDAFIVAASGSVSGTLTGGTGSLDGLAVADVGGNLTALQPAGPDESGTYSGITYAGMDAYNPLSGDNINRVVTGTIFDRNLVLTAAAPGNMTVSFENLSFSDGVNSFTFANPSASLTLITGTGGDTINIVSLDPAFTGALIQYSGGVLTGDLTAGNDTVVVAQTGVSNDGGVLINLTVNGHVQPLGSVGGGVTNIVLDGLGGADTFTIDEVLLIDEVSITGGSDSDTLIGPIAGTQWDITGADSGSALGITSFDGIENLTGRGGLDRFNVRDGGSISGQIDGGAGPLADVLIGPDVDNTWSVTGPNAGMLNGSIDFVGIESLTGGFAADVFQVGALGSLDGLLDGGLDKAVVANGTVAADDTLDFSLYGSAVSVDLALATATAINEFSRIDVIIGSGVAGDTLTGPAEPKREANDVPLPTLATGTKVLIITGPLTGNSYVYIGPTSSDSDPDTPGDQPFDLSVQDYTDTSLWRQVEDQIDWTVTGLNAGEVEGTVFSGFENLTGRGASSDYFLFGEFGSLTGLLSGGTGVGTTDGFAVSDGSLTLAFLPATANESGTITLASRTIVYAGMDSYTPLEGDDVNRKISGSIFGDDIVLEDADTGSTGTMRVRFQGLNFITSLFVPFDSFTFNNPSASLTIEAGSGGDTITVASMDPGFAADLLLYGNTAGAPTLEPDAGQDLVRFQGDTLTHGGYLEVFADKIVIDANKTLSTLTDQNDLTTGNDIVFRARRIGTTEIENLLPSGYLPKSVEIDVGAGVQIRASSIYLIAQTEDRALATTLGLSTIESQLFLNGPLSDLQDLVGLPIKVLVKSSEAKVTIGEGAQLLADDVVGVYATAGSDASAQAKSQLFSLGYSQADARATIEIKDNVLIEGNGPVNITADASATASMTTETAREEQGSVPGKRSAAFAASLAVSWARLTSTVTVAETAFVHGGRTVNIRSLGETESEAEAESSLFADGTAALALALQFSTADILTQIDGKVQADMNTNGGEVVKFEFDPTVSAAGLKSDQTSTRLVEGDTVQVLVEVPVVNPGSVPLMLPTGWGWSMLTVR
ncbi:MAG: hypothetical protein L0Z62_48090, partial [Gemmataceae bacterium]|nr:hypothetical protein [Gemmataceae bacterium]